MKKLTKILSILMLVVITIMLFNVKSLAVTITSDMINEFIDGYRQNSNNNYITNFLKGKGITEAEFDTFVEQVKNEYNRRNIALSDSSTLAEINGSLYASNAYNALRSYNKSLLTQSSSEGNSGQTPAGNSGSTSGSTSGTSGGIGDLKNQGDSFIDKGSKNEQITENEIIAILVPIGRVLVQVATIVLVVVGMIFGVKYMMAGADEKANLKQKLIWYIISIVLVYGAVGIFTIVRTVIESTLGN